MARLSTIIISDYLVPFVQALSVVRPDTDSIRSHLTGFLNLSKNAPYPCPLSLLSGSAKVTQGSRNASILDKLLREALLPVV